MPSRSRSYKLYVSKEQLVFVVINCASAMELSEIYLNTLKDLEKKVNNVKELVTNSIKWSLGYGEKNLNDLFF